MALTAEQTDSFLTEKLGIKNWKSKIEESKLELLYEVERRFKQVVYYKNISWGAKELTELKPETVESCVESVLVDGGGVCLQNNYFMYLLLKSMGFDTFVVGCSTIDVSLENNHILVIVRLSATLALSYSQWTAIEGFGLDDLYMIDVGWVRPIPCPVHLNRLPFSYRAAGFEISFQFNPSENKYEVLLVGGDPLKGAFLDDIPIRKYGTFNLIPRKFEDFDVPMTATFTNPDYGYFLHTVSMVRYISLESATHNIFVGFRGRNLIVLTPETMEVNTFETYAEMIGHIIHYFPEINHETLKKTLENYEVRQLKYKSALSLNPHATAGVGYTMKYSGAGQQGA